MDVVPTADLHKISFHVYKMVRIQKAEVLKGRQILKYLIE